MAIKDIERRRKLRRMIYSLPSLVLLLVLTLLLAKGAIGMLRKQQVSAQYSKELNIEAVALSSREVELTAQIEGLQTEAGIKNEIRERFSVTEEGEHVAIIVDDSNATSSKEGLDRSWYAKVWHAIIPFYE